MIELAGPGPASAVGTPREPSTPFHPTSVMPKLMTPCPAPLHSTFAVSTRPYRSFGRVARSKLHPSHSNQAYQVGCSTKFFFLYAA